MAHECINCGGECYCCGDMDDCIVSKTPMRCETCGCTEEGVFDFSGDDEGPYGLDEQFDMDGIEDDGL